MDSSTTAEQFVTVTRELDADETRNAFFWFIGIDPRQIDMASARHTEYMLEVSGLTEGRPRLSLDALVVRYLAPEAALHKKLDRARGLLESVDSPYYRAHGYREVLRYTHDPDDLSAYVDAAVKVDAGVGFQPGDGTSKLPVSGIDLIVDGFALATANNWSDVADRARHLLLEDQVIRGLLIAKGYSSSESEAHERYLRQLADGCF